MNSYVMNWDEPQNANISRPLFPAKITNKNYRPAMIELCKDSSS